MVISPSATGARFVCKQSGKLFITGFRKVDLVSDPIHLPLGVAACILIKRGVNGDRSRWKFIWLPPVQLFLGFPGVILDPAFV